MMIPVDLSAYAGSFSLSTELRVQENRTMSITFVNGDVMDNSASTVSGVSARTYRDGLWGFASTPMTDDASIRRIIRAATDNSKFLAEREGRKGFALPARPGCGTGDFSTSKEKASQRRMVEFLRGIDSFILEKLQGVVSRTVSLQLLDMEKSLVTSDGSSGYSMVPRAIIYVSLSAESDGGPVQLMRSFGGLGQFEDVFDDGPELADDISEMHGHLMRKAEGIHPESGIRECILDADLAGILAHEAVGHTVEADIVRGGSVAGDRMGEQVASPLVTLVDFAGESPSGTCPVPVCLDDEGTLARDAVIIENGLLRSFLHNRESARLFEAEPTGNARAYRFSDEPIIRMRNTAILPGESTVEEMISSIDNGYYLMRPGNGQADSTSEFMFAVTQGYEIRKGRLGRALRDTTISGVAFDMLKTVSMLSNEMKWSCSGMCGKKQPIPVGMGGPAVKCRMNIGGR